MKMQALTRRRSYGLTQLSCSRERIPEKWICRERIPTPRDRVVRCQEENPNCQGWSGLTWTEVMPRNLSDNVRERSVSQRSQASGC
jgi:hypothetical protein